MAQKTLIAIVQAVAAELNLTSPVSVISNQDQQVQKILALTRAVCDDILYEHDWQCLETRYVVTTVAGQDSYPFPTDIKRYISGAFFDGNNRWPMQGPKTPIEWEWLKSSSLIAPPFTQFRVYGNQFVISPVPAAGLTFNMEYISSNYVKDSSGTVAKPDFTADSDICVFDHRVVIYGVKLKMRESLALDTTANLSDYKRALEFAKGSDRPGRMLTLNGNVSYRQLSTANIPDGNWS